MAAVICNRNDYGMWLGTLALMVALSAVPATFGVDARIIEGPENLTVPLESYVNFTCIAEGDSPSWFINGEIVDDISRRNFEEYGFMFYSHSHSGNHTLTMSVWASLQYNNTVIICRVYGTSYHRVVDYSTPAKLIVIGPPSPPDPQLHMLNATTLQLSWLPPFTWPDYPIVNYSIKIHNRATSEVMNWTINATSTSVVAISPVTFNYSTPHGEVVQTCEELVFTVYATSNIGWSEPVELNGVFPIDPDNTSIEIIPVTFRSDGTPLLQLRIQLPNICHFQDLNYTITIQRVQPSHDSNAGDIVVGPKTVRGQTEVLELISSGLVANAVYSVLADIETVTGSVSSNTTFETYFQPPTEYADTTDTYETHSHSQPTTNYMDTTATSQAGSQHTTNYVDTTATSEAGIKIAIGVSTGIFITVTSGIGLILCSYVFWKRKTDGKSAEKACKAMVSNPIYEGPLYETIQPQFCSLTTLGPATDFVESRYLDKPIHPAMPNETSETGTAIAGVGTLIQRGEENAKREDFLETHCVQIPGATPSSDDNYTVMSPIGTLAYSLQGGWGIPDDFNPEEPD